MESLASAPKILPAYTSADGESIDVPEGTCVLVAYTSNTFQTENSNKGVQLGLNLQWVAVLADPPQFDEDDDDGNNNDGNNAADVQGQDVEYLA